MPALVIGRVGLDVAMSDNLSDASESARDGSRTLTLRGWLAAASLANAKTLKGELAAQTGRMVAVTWAKDPDLDGFYVLRNVSVQARVVDRPYANFEFPFTCQLERLGSEGEVEFQSLLTGTVVENTHGLVTAETKPFHAPPVGHLAYNPSTSTPTQRQRSTPDGNIDWYDTISFTVDPSWSCAPADYYKGACEVYVSTVLKSGFSAPNDPGDWELSNGIVRVKPSGGGTSDGRILVAFWDGTDWDAEFSFKTVYDPAGTPSTISAWHYVSILRNDAETGAVRLVRDSAPTTNPNRHTLDINLRRGSRFATFRHTFSGTSPGWDVTRDSNDACAAFTPTGATGAAGVEDSVSTNAFKWVMSTPVAHTARTVEGGLRWGASNNAFTYMIGGVPDTPGAGDTTDDVFLQMFGWISERDRAVRR